MKQFAFILLAFYFLCSCETGPRNLDEFLVDTSDFDIDTSVLKNGQYVKILGSSGNLTRDHEMDFYNLIVVRSEETGDTINVLTTTYYQVDLNDSRTRFLSNSSGIGKLIENAQNSESLEGINIKDLESITYDKVLYDTEFIQVDVLKYPAVTGNLGYTIEGDLDF